MKQICFQILLIRSLKGSHTLLSAHRHTNQKKVSVVFLFLVLPTLKSTERKSRYANSGVGRNVREQ